MPKALTPTTARNLLDRHGLRPRKGLGQHFLIDANTVEKIVRLAGVGPADTVLEIGPGLGSLTVALAAAARRVVALEVDSRVCAALDEVVGGLRGVEIVNADALHTDLDALTRGPARLVANLPYNMATPILAHVLDGAATVHAGLVMVQRELGERWTARPGSKTYGSISVKVAYHAHARVVADVPATVFLPPPRVRSVLVAFERRPAPVQVDDASRFLGFVASAFSHRRKTLRNGLRAAGVADADAVLARAGLEAGLRPEQVDLRGFATLYRALR